MVTSVKTSSRMERSISNPSLPSFRTADYRT
jgi:hypothetical protein